MTTIDTPPPAPPTCKVCGRPYPANSRAALAVFAHPRCAFGVPVLASASDAADLDQRAVELWSLRLRVAAHARQARR